MKKILFSCNTYFQLIAAIQLNSTVYSDDYTVMVLSDHSKNADQVANRLRETEVFNEVFFVETRYFCSEYLETKYKLPCVIDDINGNLYGMDLQDKYFDTFIYYNDNHASLGIYAALYKVNKKIECMRLEEGIGSYIIDFRYDKKAALSRSVRRILGQNNLYESTNTFYCFQPELYPGKLKPVQIPPITSNSSSVDVMKKVFLEPGTDYGIKEKYIFFGSPYDNEGGHSIGERRLVKEIAELVGYDNLIVKAHPRVLSDDYTSMGVKLYPHSSVPWEALQLTMDFSDKIFLTAVSSSVMSLNMTLEKPIRAYFLYNLTDAEKNQFARITLDMLRQFKDMYGFKPEKYNIHIAEELIEILR